MVLLLALLSGCTGRRAFLTVQLCLGGEQDVVRLVDMMKSVAKAQGMDFVDGSERTQRELADLRVAPKYKLIFFGVEQDGGMGVLVGNSGLSAYEVSMGFTDGADPIAAHRFANLVVGKLKQRWTVYVVPAGRGALPLAACRK